MKQLEFRLKKGMSRVDILNELRGHVSGESAQELAPFFADSELKFTESDPPEYEITESNDDYALVRRRYKTYDVKIDKEGKSNKSKEITFRVGDYLSGINDEGKYFLHSVDMRGNLKSLEETLNWMNRIDQGYVARIQGDICYQYRMKSQNLIYTDITGLNTPIRPLSESGRLYIFSNGFRQGIVFNGLNPPNIVQIGNHRVSTDGLIVINQGGEAEVLVDGKYCIIQHGQHGLAKEEIPEGHLLFLAPQRGRQLSVTGNMIYGAD